MTNHGEQGNNDTFQLIELVRQIKKYFWVVLLVMVLAGGSGFLVSKYLMTPQYESSVTMIVNTRKDNTTDVMNENVSAAQNLVPTYAEIVKSNAVLNKVILMLNLDTTYDDFKDDVYVDAVSETQIMKISVRNTDKKMSKKIVKAISDVTPGVTAATVEAGSCRVASEIITGNKPITPNVLKNSILMAALGFMAAVIAIILRMLFKSQSEQER